MRYTRPSGTLPSEDTVRRNTIWTCLLAAIAALPCRPAGAETQVGPHEYCGTNIPPDEAKGFVPLPEGDVFCPLLADPKAAHSYMAYVRGTSNSALGTDLASVGIGDRFNISRWNAQHAGNGVQIGLEGAVFSQFDLNSQSQDLLNADYVLGLPITWRWRGLSGRLRPYHQSSHLGDEFVLRSRIPRENFSFEAGEGILSFDAGPLRLYGGGEYLFHSLPRKLASWVVHGGMELRQRQGALRLGDFASARLVAGGDVKSVEYINWETGVSAVAGIEFSRPREGGHAVRPWSLLGHYYTGPAPYSQFYQSNIEYYGVGLHFAF